MTTSVRKSAVKKYESLVARRTPRKLAMRTVVDELRGQGIPASRPSLYRWRRKYGAANR